MDAEKRLKEAEERWAVIDVDAEIGAISVGESSSSACVIPGVDIEMLRAKVKSIVDNAELRGQEDVGGLA